MALQVHADPEHSHILERGPARHGFTSVASKIGNMTPQRIPDNTVITEGTKGDPAALHTKRHRFRHRVIDTPKHLKTNGRVVEYGPRGAGGSSQILADFLSVGQTFARGDPVCIEVPRPQSPILHVGETDPATDPEIGCEAAVVDEVEIQISEQVMRGDARYPVHRSHKFLNELVAALALRRVNIGSLIILRVPEEVLQLQAELPPERCPGISPGSYIPPPLRPEGP